MMSLAVFVSLFFLYSLFSRRLEQTIITLPIVFTVAGMLMFPALPAILGFGVNAGVLSWLAEIGLVLLLFTDASRTDATVLRYIGNLTVRLLSVGMLLTILFGAVAARLIFPHSGFRFGWREYFHRGVRRRPCGADRLQGSWQAQRRVCGGMGTIVQFFCVFPFWPGGCAQWPQFSPALALYAVLSLTVVRMLPAAIALIGTRLSLASVLFIGWFGPRGLASIVLGLVYLEEEMHLPGEATIRLAVIVTVLLSIFAHGLSAKPGIGLYARKITSLDTSST
jgi:NhaP-type Na+/H+ or K+/H+ antiporter